jgi:hypothetical protein
VADGWTGIWSGSSDFAIDIGEDYPDGSPKMIYGRLTMAIKIERFTPGHAMGWSTVSGRVGAGSCALSAEFDGSIFAGDAVSTVDHALITLSGAGIAADGRAVAVDFKGERALSTKIVGSVAFKSNDTRPGPCDGRELPFELTMEAGNGSK